MLTPSGERTIIWAAPADEAQDIGSDVPEFTPARETFLAGNSVAWIQVSEAERRSAYWQRLGGLRGLPAWHLAEELSSGRSWELIVGSLDDAALPSLEDLQRLGCRLAVYTQGSKGCLFSYEGQDWESAPARAVEQVVDTTGAGDAFLAGLLVGLRQGLPDGEAGLARSRTALSLGAAYGAEAVGEQGGWPTRRLPSAMLLTP